MLRLGVLKGFVAALVAVKLVYAFAVPPISDEAYYWLWGQHPALSYFDHAPWIGWTQGLASLPFGWTLFGLRFFTFVTLIGTALIFRHWAKRLGGADWERWFWGTLGIYLASPLILAMTSQALPDHWLLFFSLLAVHFFAAVFVDQEAGRAVRPRDLLLGGAALGLAALSKYNAVVLVPALATVVLLRRPLWPLLRNGWLYAGAGVTLLVLTPVIWWNLENGFLSVRFQLFDRYTGGGLGGLSSQGLVSFLLLSPLLLSPLLLPALVHFFMQRRVDGFDGVLTNIGKALFVVSTLSMAALSLLVSVAPHWNLLAYPVFLALAYRHMLHRYLLIAHLVLGLAASAVITGYYAGFPLTNPAGDAEASRVHAWPEVAARAEVLRIEHEAAGIGGTFYGPSAKLAFGQGAADVESFSPLPDQFDLWRDETAMLGRDFIIVADTLFPASLAEGQFERLEHLESFTPQRFGLPVVTYEIYLGRSYRGGTP